MRKKINKWANFTVLALRRINHSERILIPFKSEFDQNYCTDDKYTYYTRTVSECLACWKPERKAAKCWKGEREGQ